MALIKARPTIYKGVQMRSRLEAGFAQWLDGWDMEWEYEPHAYADGFGQYLPDFCLRDVDVFGPNGTSRRDVYIDCKPATTETFVNAADLGLRMSSIWSSDPDAVLAMAHPPTHSYDTCLWTFHVGADRVFSAPAAWTMLTGRRLGLVDVVLLGSNGPWQGEWWRG